MLKKRKAGIRMTTQGSKYNKRVEFNPGVAFKHNTRQMKTINTKVNVDPEIVNFMKPGETFISKWNEYEKIYTQKTGQKVQKKAQPLREMIVITDSHTTIEHLKRLTTELEKLTGWKALHISHHRDEGHYKTVNGKQVEPKEFITNFHSHIVFECYNKKNGKSILLNKRQMSKMQDLAAQYLDMPRGEINSGRVHLEPEQYKQAQIDKDKAVEKAIEEKNNIFDVLMNNSNKEVEKLNAVNQFISDNYNEVSKNSKNLSILTTELKKVIKALEQENKALKTANNELKNEVSSLVAENEDLKIQNSTIAEYLSKASSEIETLQDLFNAMGVGDIKSRIKETKKKFKADYADTRQLLKDSNIATQQDYMFLKQEYDTIVSRLETITRKHKANTSISI